MRLWATIKKPLETWLSFSSAAVLGEHSSLLAIKVQGLRMKRRSKHGNHGFIFFFGDLALTNLFLQVCNALIQRESPVDILCNFGA
jgi:hypothetical protein